MKDIFKITINLTIVCLAAATVLGAVYTQTEHVRKAIEEEQKQATIEGLLGFGHDKRPPSDFKLYAIHRYVINEPEKGTVLGYVVPAEGGTYSLVTIDLSGNPLSTASIEATPAEMGEQGTRDRIVKQVIPKGADAVFAESFYIANLGDKRLGYVLPGVTQGFKTFVKLMVSLNPEYTVTGVDITESEEDPGLGAEIEQNYFRNQFVGKRVDMLKRLKVVKEPLPEDYLNILVPERAKRLDLSPERIKEIEEKHKDDNIYALTGATISSDAVTRGVKNTVRKFVYRFDILKQAIADKNVQVAF